MQTTLQEIYDKVVLQRPVITLLSAALLIAFFSMYVPDFKLDASADSLVLEHDEDLRYYRAIQARYGSDDFIIITYTPNQDLFSRESLSDLHRLRNSLYRIDRVESVVSILDVPLISSPPIYLSEIESGIRTLEDTDTDLSLARKEILNSVLYRNLIISPDGKTTALQVFFKRDETFYSLLGRRDELRENELTGELTEKETEELHNVSNEFKKYSSDLLDRQGEDLAEIRSILERFRNKGRIFLGGIPMIASDMIEFIKHDLSIFGGGILGFLAVMLAIIFHRPRWVVLSILCCFVTVLFMFGYLGFMQWRVTVVSSNFTSLLLIMTLSLTVHLIERYHELHSENKDAGQHFLVSETVKSKALPSLYTALTTIVAFGALVFSGIRPVIDFGWMMAVGISVAFVMSIVIFPSSLMLLKPKHTYRRHDFTGALTRMFSHLAEKHGNSILVIYMGVALLSAVGISMLTVDNRFIDHFKYTTEIYRGMEMIDRELGGTMPLDLILDADKDFLASQEEEKESTVDEDPDLEPDSAGFTGTSYWYDEYELDTIQKVHDYLDALPETGKVLSLATTMNMMQQLNNDKPLDNILLSIIYKKMPPQIKKKLLDPYMSKDGNQVRFTMRIFESNTALRRDELIKKIRTDLSGTSGLSGDQIHLTGMTVLFNNMLQSLYRSQILTIGFVFLAIMIMFIILFRSITIAFLAIIPNMISAGIVLGLMGWLGIPLDIMTITIAAITIGIAVDNTIHYIHRFLTEIHKDYDCIMTMRRCHASIGRAMYYTSITVIIGFSILSLSSFVPTVYFGMLTGLAMMAALIANLTLLPVLLIRYVPGYCARK